MTGSTRSCPRTERLAAEAPGALPPAAFWLVIALVGLTWLPGAVLAQGRPQFDLKDPKIIAEGQALYNQRCAGRCHGVDGAEGFDGPILRGRTHLDPPYVWATLMTGRPGSAMPPWKGRFSDDDLWKIIAFVASLGDQARAAAKPSASP